MNFDDFAQQVSRYGLTKMGVFFGPFRGKVTRNDDPQKRGRIQAHVPTAQRQPLEVWIDPTFPQAANQHGTFTVPSVGASVWVEFENGDPGRPLRYMGGWFGSDKVGDVPAELAPDPATFAPNKSGTITRKGHTFVFNDEKDNESIRLIWHKPDPGDAAHTDPKKAADRVAGETARLCFEPDGEVQLAAADGSMIVMDQANEQIIIIHPSKNTVVIGKNGIQLLGAAGNCVSIESGKISMIDSKSIQLVAPTIALQGNVFLGDGDDQQPNVRGTSLLELFNTHVHPSGVGPTGTPARPATPADILSTKVKGA